MFKAYIILAHKNSAQLHLLIERLDDGYASFFLHIDKRIPLSNFNSLYRFGDKLTILPQHTTEWASFGLVEATLSGLYAIKNTGKHFEHISLLSGQDYPIKSNSFVDEFIANSPNRIFIEHFSIPNHEKWQPNGGQYRVNKYFISLKKHHMYASKSLNLLAGIFPLLGRKPPENIAFYGGSQWWTIDMYTLNYIVNFINDNPAYLAFNKFTFAADEVFFQTILLNASDEKISDCILNNNLRYVNWKSTASPHPSILNEKHLDELKGSNALFARKFDIEMDPKIFDQIDELCGEHRLVTASARNARF